MGSILFVTTRNIVNTSGELRLIKNRAKALYDKWGVLTDIYALVSNEKLKKKQENFDHYCKVSVVGFDKYNPLKTFNAYHKFRKQVLSKIANDNKIKSIVISGIMPTILIKEIQAKKPDIPVTIDVHGATEELLEYPSDKLKKFALNKILYYFFDNNLKKSLRMADSALVVSNELEKHIKRRYNITKNMTFYNVPCGINFSEIVPSIAKKHRDTWRRELSIDDETILLIYSGGVSKWQSLEDVFHLFNEIKKKLPYKCKLLVMSKQISEIKTKFKVDEKDVILRSFEPNEVQNVLYAGDIAFLLRKKSITNQVAFPNKFSEYVASGMILLSTKNVVDQSKIITENNLGVLYEIDTIKLIEELKKHIEYRKSNLESSYITRTNVIKGLNFENTLKTYVKDIVH